MLCFEEKKTNKWFPFFHIMSVQLLVVFQLCTGTAAVLEDSLGILSVYN